MSCSPYALFRHLLETEGDRYTHVWVMADPEDWKEIRAAYGDDKNVKFVVFQSPAYHRYLACAQYLVNNVTFPPYFRKREGQIYVNTWHGIPLKKMGYDMPDGAVSAANIVRNFLQADYLLSPNLHHTQMYLQAYRLDPIYSGTILEMGQTRTDTIVRARDAGERRRILKKLRTYGVAVDGKKKILLYAPTWRGTNWDAPTDAAAQYDDFYARCCRELDMEQYTVLIKPHVSVYKKLKKEKQWTRPYFVPGNLDANEILAVTDVLISDYSSIFYDYLMTGKPVLFYCSDLEEYATQRGVEDLAEHLPGPVTDRLEELFSMLKDIPEIQKRYAGKYEEIRKWACPCDDGSVSRRVADVVFRKREVCQPGRSLRCCTDKKKLLFFLGAFRSYGITSSLLALLKALDPEKYDVTLYGYPPADEGEALRMGEVPSHVRILLHTQGALGNPADTGRFLLTGSKEVVRKVGRMAFRRMFGQTEFDRVIDFVGYSPLFSAVASNAPCGKKLVWQHSDLHAEIQKKVGGRKVNARRLRQVFRCYPDYDWIVSCSPGVMKSNRRKLKIAGTAEKYTYVKNLIDLSRIREGLAQEPDVRVESKGLTFVTMGRISPEKNFESLIHGFVRFHEEYPESRLYLLGEGSLRAKLEKIAGESQGVVFTGNLSNPFPVLKACDCFVLPSLYEGQPMVVMEARVVGLPILVADFDTVKDCLTENGQLIIGKTEDEILKGLRAFAAGEVPRAAFDGEAYNRHVIEKFDRLME